MNANPNLESGSTAENGLLLAALQDLVSKHGSLRLLAALPKALLGRGNPPRLSDRQLSNHLRRDIGLNDQKNAPKTWEHYR